MPFQYFVNPHLCGASNVLKVQGSLDALEALVLGCIQRQLRIVLQSFATYGSGPRKHQKYR